MTRLPAMTRDDRGATIVEFALVVPVVLVLLIACIDFARVLTASVTIQNASREGARYATLHPTASPEDIRAYLAGRVVPLDAGLVTVVTALSTSTDPRCALGVAPTSCTWATGQPAPTTVTVTVTYPWNAATWLIGPMLFAATNASSLQSAASMESIQ
jgi:Flp pilus assembly protein TadG